MAGSTSLTFRILGKDESASKTFKKVGADADKLHKTFGTMAAGFAGGALASGVINFGKSSVAAFKEAQLSQASLQAAFEKFPKLADVSMSSLQGLNSQLAKKTKYDDDALGSGQAVLAQFNLTGKQIKSVTPLLADYASKTGQDLPSAAKALGMAFNGNTRALKAVGINYKSTGDAGKDFTNIQALLNAKVGGFSTKEGKTAAGQAAILGNQYGEIQETVGSKLVPALTKLAGGLLSVVDFMSRNSKVIAPLAVGVLALAAGIKAYSIATTVATFAQKLLNREMTLNPIGLVIAALAAFAIGIAYAWKHSETFRTVVTGAFKAVGTVVLTVIDGILWGYQKLAEGAGKLPGPLGEPFRAAAEKIAEVRGGIDTLQGKLDDLGKKVTYIKFAAVEVRAPSAKELAGVGGTKGLTLSGTRAAGGPVLAGGAYLVGERGPEIFSPSGNGAIIPNQGVARGGTTVHVNISGPVYGTSAKQLARDLAPEMMRAIRDRSAGGQRLGIV